MNKKHVIISGVMVVISFIVGFFIGDASAISRVNKAVDAKVSDSTSNSSTTSSTSTETENSKIYNLNEQGKSGNWNIKVLEVKESNSVAANGDMVKTDQKFVIVKLEMQNNYTSPVQYSISEFALINTNNKASYNATLEAAQILNNDETIYKKNTSFVGVYTDVNPGMTKNTYVTFEVPKDVNISDLILANTNDGSSNTAVGFKLK